MDGRATPFDLPPDEFRRLGHRLVDELADFLESIPTRPVTPGEPPDAVRSAMNFDADLPENGVAAEIVLADATELIVEHSLLPGHPRFFGYVVGAPTPLGALGDLLAATVNPNVGGWLLAPVATAIEQQTIRWIAELVGYPAECGGLLVSGGNMGNFIGFLAARRAHAGAEIRGRGVGESRLCAYVSAETHTWIHKAADLFGLGTDAIRWIPTDTEMRMDAGALREQIAADRAAGRQPFLVVGTSGTVATGAVDPLAELAETCRAEGLWFHVDGAYGAPAAMLPDASDDLRAIAAADSLALDPHKWLYAPLEAGAALVRDPQALVAAFSYRPDYYHLAGEEEERLNFFELGPQNSRGFRALKVWLALRHAGRAGYIESIATDVELARRLYRLAETDPELEAGTHGLSITTFRYVPDDAAGDDEYLDRLNEELCTRLEDGGEVFVSNAILRGRFFLRACIVNFRTSESDIDAVPEVVRRVGREVHTELRAELSA